MSNILTGFNMQGNDPIDNRIVSPSKFETLEEYLQRVPIQKRYYGLSFYALDENNELRHYTFQTSLIEPTIDDDEEEIERLDKELQEHVNNKEIHKTSEEIRSEIVDADIPNTIARVQWTLDQIEEAVNTVMGDIVDGASDEYNTLKKIQDKIVELRTEMESQLYGDDGGEVLKTLEQALKFLNQYKDFIVDIPDNYVNKQDIVDNLNTDDPTKVLSARQGKVLSETLTNYFDSAMASIRAETNRATGAENRIEAKLDDEIDRSTAEDIRIQGELDAEENRAQSEEKRIEDKLDAEIERSTTKDTELGNQIIAETDRAEGEEQRIETKLDNEITRSTDKDDEHDSRIEALEGETHIQNTDIGTTSQTFQLQMGKPGNKIKNEDAAVSVRNATDTDYVNFIAKNATFKGDLIVEGQSFVTEAETVEIKDNILLLNKGEAGSGVTKGMAGLQIDRGTEPDFQILFVESDRRFKAGEEGNLQCLALRDDDGNMLDGMFTTWDSATHRLKTTNIIPSIRKLFFNTNTNSLGFVSHTYDSSYSVESFTFTNALGSLFFSAGESNLNLDTDKTYFRFYKNLMIPSSIISSGTSISLLNNSGATIATFGSPSTINSSLNVANQVIIKEGSDTKLIMQSADADNFNLIESQNSSGTVLSKLGYYGTFWGIDNKKIATEEFANNKFLPLAGGTMTGHIILSNTKALYGKSKEGNNFNIAFISDSNTLTLGSSLTTHISSSTSDLIHLRDGTQYKIYDSYNFNPGNYLPLAGGTMTGSIIMSNNITIQSKDSSGNSKRLIGKGSDNVTYIGDSDGHTFLYSDAADIIHMRNGTSYRIWDASNLDKPVRWGNDGDNPHTIYRRNLGINGTTYGFLSENNSNSTSIYAPTAAGTSGQVLTSTGGVPTWSNISSIGDGRYVLKSGDTMTGALENSSYIKSLYWKSGQSETAWSSDKTPNDYTAMSLYLEDDYNGGSGISSYGTILTFSGRSSHWVNQLRISGGASELSIRSCTYNATPANRTWTAWTTLPNKNYISSNYLKLTGGTLTGALTISLSSVAPIILNNTNASSTEVSQTFRIGGTSKGYFGYTTSTGVFMQNSDSSIICVKSNGAYYGTSTNTLTKLLTSADLSSYATQSWATSNFYPLAGKGYLSFDSSGRPVMAYNQGYAAKFSNGITREILWTGGAATIVLGLTTNDATIQIAGTKLANRVSGETYATQEWVNSQGFIKSVSGYLPLTGGTMSGSITIPGNSGTLVITANETSNYVRGISFTKGSTVNSAVFGYHSTGGDGTGSIVISPYPTSASPWNGNIGLFITKGSVKIDDVPLATQTWVNSQGFLKTSPSITISNSGSGNAVTAITASGHTLTVTKGATYLTSSSLSGYATQSWVTSQGYLTSSSLSGYATQTWVNNKNYAVRESDNVLISHSNEFNFTASSNTSIAINYRGGSGSNTSAAITEYRFYNGQGSYSNVNILANSFTGSLIGNASSATTATKLGSSTIGGTAKPIYLSSGTATACSATVGSSTVPVYMSSGTITQCSTTLGVSITGNAATATTASNSNNLGGYAAATYVKSTSTTKVSDIQVVTTAGSTTGVLYVVLES